VHKHYVQPVFHKTFIGQSAHYIRADAIVNTYIHKHTPKKKPLPYSKFKENKSLLCTKATLLRQKTWFTSRST